jgi:hypothetical protein
MPSVNQPCNRVLAKVFSDASIMRRQMVCLSPNYFRHRLINKTLSPMPFFVREFSLAPSHLAAHHNSTNEANLPPPDNGKIAKGSGPNVSGTSEKAAARAAGNKPADGTGFA